MEATAEEPAYEYTYMQSIKEHEIIGFKSGGYLVEHYLGQGCFGNVAQCVKLDTKEKVAVKILDQDDNGSVELLMYLSRV